jgi:hypothetical protein
MKLRSLGTALIAFFLGAAAYWGVSTHTDWLRFLNKRSEFRAVNTNAMEWVAGGKAWAGQLFDEVPEQGRGYG